MNDYSYGDDSDIDRARRAQRRKRRPTAPTALVLLLEEYNAALGWNQSRLSEMSGIDVSQLNKIFIGETRNPHYTTLKRLAAAYRSAGLMNVTAEMLQAAKERDQIDEPEDDIPPQWRRLVRRVLAHGDLVQDSFYRKWSLDFTETVNLIARAQQSPPDPDSPDTPLD